MGVFANSLESLFNTAMDIAQQLGVTETFVHLLTEYRGWIVVFFVLPISFAIDSFISVKCQIDAFMNVMFGDSHDKKVRHVQKQVKNWNANGKGKSLMCTARKPFLTMSTRTADFKKECSQIEVFLDQILEIEESSMTIRTEPLVSMGQMTKLLLPKRLALAVHVEMEDLTIGGLTMGLGMETSSHRLGLIQETVVAFEIVLSSGELIKVTRDNEHNELFKVLPFSQGSLGFLVAVTLQIVHIKPYVQVKYIPCHSMQDYCEQMKKLSTAKNAPHFLEATVYSKETAVIQCGEFVDIVNEDQKKINRINLWYKPWYYKHVERALSDLGGFSECIPTGHYYHRYTRSIFWELEDLIPFGNNPMYRFFFGWLGAPKVSLLKASMTPNIRREVLYKHVVQDIIIPIRHMEEGMKLFHEEFCIYPILVFPIRIYENHGGFLRSPKHLEKDEAYEMFVDLGAYGVPLKVTQKKEWDAISSLRKMEAFTRRVGGYQCLYADTLMTSNEFRQMYDHTLYDEMRKKYQAVDAFPELYDKIVPERHLFEVKKV